MAGNSQNQDALALVEGESISPLRNGTIEAMTTCKLVEKTPKTYIHISAASPDRSSDNAIAEICARRQLHLTASGFRLRASTA